MADYTPTIPSKETVDFLYRGLVAFYPWTVFGKQKAKSMGYVKKWEGFESSDFTLLVTNITKTDDVDSGAKIILQWKRAWDKEAYPTATIPKNLDDLVKDLEENSKTKGKETQAARLAKQSLLQSEVAKEKGQIKVEEEPSKEQVETSSVKREEDSTKNAQAKISKPPAKTPDVSPTKGSPGLVLQITKNVNLNPVGKLALSFAQLPFFLSGPSMASSSPVDHATATAQNMLFIQGVTSSTFKTAIKPRALALGINSSQIDKLIAEIAKQEKAFPGLFQTISSSFDIQSIVVKAGIPQATAGQLFLTEGDAGSLVIPRKGFLGNFLGRVGQQVFGGLAKKAVKSTISKVTAEAGAALGSEIPVVGTLIGAAVGWVVGKVAEKVVPFLQKSAKYVVGIPLVAGGIFIQGAAGMGMVGFGAGVMLFPKGGISSLGKSIGNATSFFFSSLLLPSLVTPIIGILIGLPLLIAFILFIINSGAYVVPPQESFSAGGNPYITVEKVAEPPGPFENKDLPLSITYSVTITPKKGTLTNLKFKHKCEVHNKNNTFNCPAPLPENIPTIISPVEPYVFTYTQTFSGTQYRDSLILNTFEVTADTGEVLGTNTSGSASIIIGNPPTGCYKVAGDWPSNDKAAITAAITNLVSNDSAYITKLCAAWPEVNIYYNPARVSGCGIWGCAPPQDGNSIYLNSGGLKNLRNATYILAHESGHVLSYGNGFLYQEYVAFPGVISELPVCTYGGNSKAEGFAESIAKYAINDSCLNNEPNNKKFAQTKIFQ